MLYACVALSLTGEQALRSTVARGTAAAATPLPWTKPALSASASRVSPGSPTMKMFGDDNNTYNNQVTPDNNAWKGGSEQTIAWKFEGAVPEVDIWLYRPEFGLHVLGTFVKLLACKIKNTGSHVVTVPTGLVPGKYFVRVESASDNRVSSFSPTFTIDKSATPPKITDVALGFLPFR
jgi:hypothetical protein